MRAPALALLAGLAGCATAPDQPSFTQQTIAVGREGAHVVQRAFAAPSFTPVADPSPLTGADPVMMPVAASASASAAGPNSLWQAGARTFFNDQRANKIGDILTVKVSIDDKAELDNSSTRTRTSATDVGVTNLFGKEETLGRLLPPGGNFDPANMVGAKGSSNANGQGAIKRKEKIDLTLAATIGDILPNGNLVVVGRQEVRINGELRELTVAGVARPEDIGADNSIRHDQLAEARINYGGRGQLSAIQRPRWGQRVVDTISPW